MSNEWIDANDGDVKFIFKCDWCEETEEASPDELMFSGIPTCFLCEETMTHIKTQIKISKN